LGFPITRGPLEHEEAMSRHKISAIMAIVFFLLKYNRLLLAPIQRRRLGFL
jgi:hypothetical protein